MPHFTFKEAAAFKVSMRRYVGKSLNEIASTDEGLKFLDWLIGEKIHDRYLEAALTVFMADPAIQKELRDIRGR